MDTRDTSSAPPRPPLAQRLHAWAGIVVVPAVWVLHLLVCVTLIATACAGGVAQHNTLSWPTVDAAVRTLSALAFAVAIVCTLLAWRAWRRAAMAAHADTAETGGDHGKHRFLTLCGAMASSGFTAGLVFTASVMIAASPSQLCGPFQ